MSGFLSGAAARLAAALLAVGGASSVGFDWVQVYLSGTVGHAVQTGAPGVNVLRYIPPAQWAAIFAKTSTYDATADINAAINAVGEGRLHFPRGTFRHDGQLILKNKIQYVGEGYQATRLHYTGTLDGVVIANPINASTLAAIHISGLYFYGPNIAQVGAMHGNLFDTGSSLVTIDRCFFDCPKVGLILDQSELVTVSNSYMAGGLAGAWLVAGTDRNPGASAFYTNRIKFDSCQFNGSGAYIGIVDDGGTAHELVSCNFNAGTNYIRACQVNNLTISGGEYELCTGAGVQLALTKWQSGAAALKCQGVTVNFGYWYHAGTNPCIDIPAAGCGTLTVCTNTFQTNSISTISGYDNCDEVIAEGNVQIGAGDGFGAPNKINNRYGPLNAVVPWTADTTNPALGNGTLSANISRHGRRASLTVSLTIGSTTTLGVGNWLFGLPIAATSINDNGAGFCVAGGLVVASVARSNVPVGKVTLYAANNTGNAVQAAVPAAWVAGNTLEFTLDFTPLNKLG